MSNRMIGNGSRSLRPIPVPLSPWLMAVILVVTFSTACADQQGTLAMNAGQVKQVQGQEWRLEGLRVDGEDHTVPTQSQATLQLQDDGSVNGVAFVNRFFGKVKVADDGALMWGDAFGATKMAGPPELMDFEQLYLGALPKTSSMRLEAEQLILESEDETTRLQFRAAEDSNS